MADLNSVSSAAVPETTSAPAPKPELKFSPAQQAVIDSRNKNLLVSASAGAGKTAVLVERLCQLVLKERISISSILAMTFTEDAAREMKTRLKQRLMQQSGDPWIDMQISQLETASISTIHSFCLDIVGRYYYLVDLSYSTATHVDNGLADQQALAQAIEEGIASLDPKAGAALSVYLEAYSKTEKDLQEVLLKFLELARSKPDWKAWIQSCATADERIADFFYDWFKIRIQALIDIFEEVVERVGEMSFSKQLKQDEYLTLFNGKIQKLELCRKALEEKNYVAFAHAFTTYIETTGKFTPTINKQSFKEIQADSRKLEGEIAKNLFTPDQFKAANESTIGLQKTFTDLAIRYAEVLLSYLEAKLEAGEGITQTLLDETINKVRGRGIVRTA